MRTNWCGWSTSRPGKLDEPRIAEALAWPGRLIKDHGWQYEIWSGADPVLLASLRFLAGYRKKDVA